MLPTTVPEKTGTPDSIAGSRSAKLMIEESKQAPRQHQFRCTFQNPTGSGEPENSSGYRCIQNHWNLATLTEVWNLFTADLKKNKNSAAQSFEGAELRILDEQRFEILTNNNLEQRFIEQEKRKLSDLLQERFQQ